MRLCLEGFPCRDVPVHSQHVQRLFNQREGDQSPQPPSAPRYYRYVNHAVRLAMACLSICFVYGPR